MFDMVRVTQVDNGGLKITMFIINPASLCDEMIQVGEIWCNMCDYDIMKSGLSIAKYVGVGYIEIRPKK